jgi:hypothetical protein
VNSQEEQENLDENQEEGSGGELETGGGANVAEIDQEVDDQDQGDEHDAINTQETDNQPEDEDNNNDRSGDLHLEMKADEPDDTSSEMSKRNVAAGDVGVEMDNSNAQTAKTDVNAQNQEEKSAQSGGTVISTIQTSTTFNKITLKKKQLFI